jgi:hypothetical protein
VLIESEQGGRRRNRGWIAGTPPINHAWVLTRKYDGVGRSAGFSLGTTWRRKAHYDTTYGYDTVGRFSALSWNVGGALSQNLSGAEGRAATYSYLPDSDLLQTTVYPGETPATIPGPPDVAIPIHTRLHTRVTPCPFDPFDKLRDGRLRSEARPSSPTPGPTEGQGSAFLALAAPEFHGGRPEHT